MNDSLSIVVPVYNSCYSLIELYTRIHSILRKLNNVSYEIVFIDDNSLDNSWKIIERICEKDSNVKGIKLKNNHGQQNTILCGLKYSDSDFYITIDDDLQHKPENIMELYNEIIKGYDVVYALSRNVIQSPFYRNIGSKLRDIIFRYFLDMPQNINISSFRIMSKHIRDYVINEKSSFVYISAIILKHTKNIGNIYINNCYRKYGRSNYSFIKLIKLCINIIIYYSNIKCLKIFTKENEQFIIEKTLNI